MPIAAYADARAWMLLSRICIPTNAIEPITPTTARVSRTVLLNMRIPVHVLQRPRLRMHGDDASLRSTVRSRGDAWLRVRCACATVAANELAISEAAPGQLLRPLCPLQISQGSRRIAAFAAFGQAVRPARTLLKAQPRRARSSPWPALATPPAAAGPGARSDRSRARRRCHYQCRRGGRSESDLPGRRVALPEAEGSVPHLQAQRPARFLHTGIATGRRSLAGADRPGRAQGHATRPHA